MQFTPTTPFKVWLNDRLGAAYVPGLGYSARNERMLALVSGGTLPGSETVTIEMPDLSQAEIKPGEECPGWLKTGLVSLTGFRPSGVAGAAEVVKKEG